MAHTASAFLLAAVGRHVRVGHRQVCMTPLPRSKKHPVAEIYYGILFGSLEGACRALVGMTYIGWRPVVAIAARRLRRPTTRTCGAGGFTWGPL